MLLLYELKKLISILKVTKNLNRIQLLLHKQLITIHSMILFWSSTLKSIQNYKGKIQEWQGPFTVQYHINLAK